MNRRNLLKTAACLLPGACLPPYALKAASNFVHEPPLASGPFLPNWGSLSQYQVPDWYKNAKFGIWAHWGPQCQPGFGDWYGRGMYQEGSDQYNYHLKTYGHPSEFGFKDVINEWKADKWNPEELVSLYKNAGARYFVALANHHDNFDNYNSKHQTWNSVNIGPKKDLIAGWAKAAKNNNLPFGVSVHASHTWSWLEVAQRHDLKGPQQGIPYDGNISKKQGRGKWWEGYDPQELYAQQHPLSKDASNNAAVHRQWDWGDGVALPSASYCNKFYKRTLQLINDYEPDLLYFDDTVLPFWPISDIGLKIAAHMYNESIKRHGSLQAVINGKILNDEQRKCLVWDIERGQSNETLPYTWQTDTCIGNWHYDKRVFEMRKYKSAQTVIHTLADVVSKNGNLLLSIPLKGDGSLDEEEIKIVQGITEWMKINSEAIYDTHPYRMFGEGPALQNLAALNAQGFNEGKGKPFTAEDIRFTQKDDIVYAITLGKPASSVLIKSLAGKKVQHVALLGYADQLDFQNTDQGLSISLPTTDLLPIGVVFKIKGAV